MTWSHLPHTGGHFGKAAFELSGIIVHSAMQGQGIGTELVRQFTGDEAAKKMIAYTRNPSLLRVLGEVSSTEDVLVYDKPELVAAQIPHAEIASDGHIYHRGRYAPDGLYGSYDPATRRYNGEVLNERCAQLQDPNNALAVAVVLDGGSYE